MSEIIEAELKRRNELGNAVDWKLVDDADNPATGLSDPVVDQGARDRLDNVVQRLDGALSRLDDVIAELQTGGDAVDVSDRAGRLLGVVSAASLPLPSGAATEATLAQVEEAVDGLQDSLDSLAAEDFATQATLAAVLAAAQAVDAALGTTNTTLDDARDAIREPTRARGREVIPASVGEGQTVELWADTVGRLKVILAGMDEPALLGYTYADPLSESPQADGTPMYLNLDPRGRVRLAPESRSSRFTRLLKFEPSEGEELRAEETTTDRYHGAAPDGTLTSAAAWDVVRFYKTTGEITRVRFRTGVVWDDRAAGW